MSDLITQDPLWLPTVIYQVHQVSAKLLCTECEKDLFLLKTFMKKKKKKKKKKKTVGNL